MIVSDPNDEVQTGHRSLNYQLASLQSVDNLLTIAFMSVQVRAAATPRGFGTQIYIQCTPFMIIQHSLEWDHRVSKKNGKVLRDLDLLVFPDLQVELPWRAPPIKPLMLASNATVKKGHIFKLRLNTTGQC